MVCGVGKSGYVGLKLVASLKSLGVRAGFLHPVEGLHGDLGDVDEVCYSTYLPFPPISKFDYMN